MQARSRTFILLFSTAFTLYSGLNFYIFYKGGRLVPERYKLIYVVACACIASSYVAGRILERFSLSWLSGMLVWAGSFWLAAMVYFFLACLGIDLLRLIDIVLPIFPSFVAANPQATNRIVAGTVAAAVSIAVLTGYLNARTPR